MRLRAVAAGALDAVDDLRGRLQVQVVEAWAKLRTLLSCSSHARSGGRVEFLGEDYTALHFLSWREKSMSSDERCHERFHDRFPKQKKYICTIKNHHTHHVFLH